MAQPSPWLEKTHKRAKISNNPDHGNDYKHIQKLTNKHLKTRSPGALTFVNSIAKNQL